MRRNFGVTGFLCVLATGCSTGEPTKRPPIDSSAQPIDAGTQPVDATTEPVDAGTQPVDAGPQVPDAGTQPVDAGPLPLQGGGSIQPLPYSTNDLVFDPMRHVLYASVDSLTGAAVNSVIIIDPTSARVTGAFPVGGVASVLAISDDASALYVAVISPGDPAAAIPEIDGGDSVRRIDLASMAVGAPVSMGSFRTAGQIAAVPGSSTRYVVSRRQPGTTPDFAGLALYEGVTLVEELNYPLAGDGITFSDPSTLFACSNYQGPSDLLRLSVSSTAITAGKDVPGLIDDFQKTRIIANGGSLFVNDGHVVDAATMAAIGSYNSSATVLSNGVVPITAAFLPDPDGVNVWFVHNDQTGFYFLFDFDRTTFLLRRRISLAPVMADYDLSNASALVRWSPTGLAFRTFNAVYLMTVPN